MSEINLVRIEEIIEMHDQWIKLLGGSPGSWAPNVLLYAYEVQLSPYYETLFEKAANFGGRITKEHAFVDCNKRTGYSCIECFLAKNGYTLLPNFSEAYEVFRRLALGTRVPGEITYAELAEWLQVNAIPIN